MTFYYLSLRSLLTSEASICQAHLTQATLHNPILLLLCGMLFMLLLANNSSFLPDLYSTPLQILRIASLIRSLIVPSNQVRSMSKQVVHLLERQVLRLREEEIEEQRVREVADDEQVVVPVTDVRHGRAGDLPDQGVKSEGDHGRDGDAFSTRPRVEDLGGNDPGEGPAGRGEGEVVEPCADDESPGCSVVVG